MWQSPEDEWMIRLRSRRLPIRRLICCKSELGDTRGIHFFLAQRGRKPSVSMQNVQLIQGRWVCPCGKSYKSKTSLSLHMRLECGKDPQFKCDHCPYKAYQKIALQKHTYCKHRSVVKTD